MSTEEGNLPDIRIDTSSLYREEVFTDRRVGTIQRLVPVKEDGSDDPGRQVLYLGQTQVMTPVGALPLSFELEAQTLGQAIERFPEAAKQALEQTMDELKEMRREQASRIVTPDQAGGMGGLGGAGGPGGSHGPGGGFQMP